MSSRRWPAYLAAVWAAGFAALSFYWALGGDIGVTEVGRSLERGAGFVVDGVVKLLGALFALALVRASRQVSFWVALIGGAVTAVYGASELFEQLLVGVGVLAEADVDRLLWFLLDPFWFVGGTLFILAALEVRQRAGNRPAPPAPE